MMAHSEERARENVARPTMVRRLAGGERKKKNGNTSERSIHWVFYHAGGKGGRITRDRKSLGGRVFGKVSDGRRRRESVGQEIKYYPGGARVVVVVVVASRVREFSARWREFDVLEMPATEKETNEGSPKGRGEEGGDAVGD